MKKIIIIFLFIGCAKEQDPCKCGALESKGRDEKGYYIDVKNNCSNKISRLHITKGYYDHANKGTNYCNY